MPRNYIRSPFGRGHQEPLLRYADFAVRPELAVGSIVLVRQYVPGGAQHWVLGRVLEIRGRGGWLVRTRRGDYGYRRNDIRIVFPRQLEGLDLSGL